MGRKTSVAPKCTQPEASDGVKIRLARDAHGTSRMTAPPQVLCPRGQPGKVLPSGGAFSLMAPKMAGPLGQLSARRVQGQYQNEESMTLQFERAWFSVYL